MNKGPALSIKANREGDWQRLLFFGPITEEAKPLFTSWLSKLTPKVVLDLSGVTYLNSCGIRDWSYFLKTLKTGREVVFDKLPDEVVRTMNMVSNFHGKVPVRSVYRAYGCDHCGHEQMEFFSEGKDYVRGQLPTPPPRNCAKCGKASASFETDEEFFQFLLTA